jgi:DNA-binding Xre family transcriptional regulator
MAKLTLTEQETERVRQWLTAVMERHGIRPKDLIVATGLSESALRKLRNGSARRVEKTAVAKIGEALGLHAQDLMDHAQGKADLPIPEENPLPSNVGSRVDQLEQSVLNLAESQEALRRELAKIRRLLGQDGR